LEKKVNDSTFLSLIPILSKKRPAAFGSIKLQQKPKNNVFSYSKGQNSEDKAVAFKLTTATEKQLVLKPRGTRYPQKKLHGKINQTAWWQKFQNPTGKASPVSDNFQ
jgi:hypothetical protein